MRRSNPHRPPGHAFTRTDALVTIATLSVVAVLVAVPWLNAKRRAREARCVANLQQVARAVLHFADANLQSLPARASLPGKDLWWWYKEDVKSYAGLSGASSTNDAVFACPNDRGYTDPKPFSRNPRFDFTSYVFNGVTLPGMPHIAGRKVDSIAQPTRTLLVMEWTAHAPLSWHRSRTSRRNHPFYNNAASVVAFVDGHVVSTPIYYDGFNAAFTRDPIPGYAYQYSGH